ncbi:MAG TPA: PaaI family thioesterase [Kofleriaceae bacterium]|nr:PaaI family thioesterase [Kofleriaceae bacterium]
MTPAIAIQDQLMIENHCFGCGPHNPHGLRIKSFWDGDETICTFTPGADHTAGPRHILNGGIIATIMDCHSMCTAIAAAHRAEQRPIASDPHVWCVTASMQLDFRKPTPLHDPVQLRARVERVDGRRLTIACTLASGGVERVHGTLVAVRVPPDWRAPA